MDVSIWGDLSVGKCLKNAFIYCSLIFLMPSVSPYIHFSFFVQQPQMQVLWAKELQILASLGKHHLMVHKLKFKRLSLSLFLELYPSSGRDFWFLQNKCMQCSRGQELTSEWVMLWMKRALLFRREEDWPGFHQIPPAKRSSGRKYWLKHNSSCCSAPVIATTLLRLYLQSY